MYIWSWYLWTSSYVCVCVYIYFVFFFFVLSIVHAILNIFQPQFRCVRVCVCVCASTSEHDIIVTSRHYSILFGSGCGFCPAPTSTQSRLFSSILSKTHCLLLTCAIIVKFFLVRTKWSSYLAANNTHCFLYIHFIVHRLVCVCRWFAPSWLISENTHFETSPNLSVSPYSGHRFRLKEKQCGPIADT